MTKTPRPAWIGQTLNSAERNVIRDCVLAAIGVVLITVTACSMSEAAPVTCDQRGCSDWHGVQKQRRISQSTDAHGNATITGRPSECRIRIRGRLIPYCGCAVSVKVFGKAKPELFLAANWYRKFPRTSPAPRMVAARSGHVMMLLSHVEGNDWYVYDPNSGGGLTRQHVRSIRGYRVVNPHGSYAEN